MKHDSTSQTHTLKFFQDKNNQERTLGHWYLNKNMFCNPYLD